MFFSIVVPVYNIEKYIKQCIDSILVQTFSDFELILVDDGSTDNCSVICDNYATIDSRVKVIHKSNGGVVSARQAGVKMCTGEYLITVDGDDYIEPQMLKEIFSVLTHNDYPDIVFFGHSIDREGVIVPKSINVKEGLYNRDEIESMFPELIRGINGKYFSPTLWSKAIKMSLVKKHQLNVDTNISLGDDGCVVFPCMLDAQSMYCLNNNLYYYRINMNSITNGRKKGYHWNTTSLLIMHYNKVLPLDRWEFSEQLSRTVTHNLFNVAKSWLQTKEKYSVIRKQIKEQFALPIYQPYIKNCKFKNNLKEEIATFLVKNKCVFGIKIVAMYELTIKKYKEIRWKIRK